MNQQPLCGDCGEPMELVGNLTGVVLTSYPPQEYITYACYKCKTKQTVLISAPLPEKPDLSGFKEQS